MLAEHAERSIDVQYYLIKSDTVGVDNVYKAVLGFRERFGPMYWEVPKLLEEIGRSGGKFADVS